MHDNHSLLEARAKRVLRERIEPRITQPVAQLQITRFDVTDDPTRLGQGEPITFDQALKGEYLPFQIGQQWGPAWGTTWFKMSGEIPADVNLGVDKNYELLVDLGWQDHSPGFQAEGLVYSPDGAVIKAINPRNTWIPLPEAQQNSKFTIYIEAAANPLLLDVPPFQPTELGDKTTSPATPIYRLAAAQIVEVDNEIRALAFDLQVLTGLVEQLPQGSQERMRLTIAINDAINLLDLDDIAGSTAKTRTALQPLLAAPALPGAHQLTAVGHAHIDSAWLWPIRETRRKVSRTIANVLRLLDDGADMVFALPAAQHVAWLEQDSPQLFQRLKEWVANGRIVPVGGMWVEPDAMLPGGEAMCRQLIEGQKYFNQKFGITCDGIWLPDSFGYSAALPQIASLAGAKWFLTQKISWNQTDVFPHHTLNWEGIDGTRLFTHFPPADTYGAEITPKELNHAATNFKDRARASSSMLLYGYGDGGGGPTRDMLERLRRMSDLQGMPNIKTGSPDEFFTEARNENNKLPIWVGELYLELHRGTLTSQAQVKLANRQAEAALRQAETWAATAAIRNGLAYPYEQFQQLWRTVLLLQFHDILPGSSVAWVYRDQQEMHANVIAQAEQITEKSCQTLGEGLFFNCAPVSLQGVSPFGAASEVEVASLTTCVENGDGWTITNGTLSAKITTDGLVASIIGADGRELVPPGEKLGELWIYQDFPNTWDAWDIDEFYKETGQPLAATQISADGDQVSVQYSFGKSTAKLTWTIASQPQALEAKISVDWHESEKLLKLKWPLDVHTDQASYETQMGYLRRPIHENTTWDANKFEVAAHRWIHIGEPGWGVGICNEATYGWSHQRKARIGGATFSELGASLLRASKFPDPHQDQGEFTRRFWIIPGVSIAQTQNVAYQMNLPLWHKNLSKTAVSTPKAGGDAGSENIEALKVEPLISASGIIVEAIKLAEDRTGDLIIRGYEPSGTRQQASVTFNIPVADISAVNLLENSADITPEISVDDATVNFQVHPFQIVTLRARLS